ncbi:protein argonaute 2-like [Senna tora]|uniref:Protein argonaute 2-like n=1 Tax=Senna tora TaxID=362788 RepID=A0A835CGT3_9FABA|nr:protein argonaute 2-like [Senna tora]
MICVVPKQRRLQISEEKGSTSSCLQEDKDRILPVHRPDKGGTIAIQTSRLRVNHFLVKFRPESIVMHYNVDVKPKLPGKHGRPQKISKFDLSLIREKLFSIDPARLPLGKTAYDGEKSIFSAVPLPEETFIVDVSRGEDEKSISYAVTLTLVNKLEFRKLKQYLCKEVFSIPRDILQGMDLVVKENPSRRTVSLGRHFYPTNPPLLHKDLHHGVIAIAGFQHSLKPTSQGLSLCLDYSVLSFRKRMSVFDFLRERIKGFNLKEFEHFRYDVENELIGLKVHVTHRRSKQKYTITKITKRNTGDLSFPKVDPEGHNSVQNVRLVDYFKEKWDTDIMYKDIPCLDFGKGNNIHYVPMEFCVLVDGQRFPKENLDWDATNTLKTMSLAKPKERQRAIQKMVESSDGPCGGGIIQNFGMEVNRSMTAVEGRIIGPPKLKLGDPSGKIMTVAPDRENCQWNLIGKSMVEGKPVERWGILDFTASGPFKGRLRTGDFIYNLINKYKKFGIYMNEPVLVEASSMRQLSSYDSLCHLLENVNDKAYRICRGRLQFLLCVMDRRDNGYKTLKWVSETKVGIVTQCCLSGLANNGKDQYLTNLALKINAKLGGSNVELNNSLPYFNGNDNVMFIGADVNHPAARDTNSPSIVAVVATVNWPAANRYAARVCPQFHRKEQILNFGEICLELLGCYESLNGVKPGKIVIFRDGVSEGQFDMVLNEELQDLKRTFRRSNYIPTISLIVAQKRHQTRFFPEGPASGNVSPGTVVDTIVIHPFEFDFYLCSHHGSMGTSKPTHYHVLWDEHRFTSDELQKLIYDMCFTFARCTKPVSLVPPVYYADLAAYRGRLYHEARIAVQSPDSVVSTSSSVISSSLSSAASVEQGNYRLHADLENVMFFV